MGMEVLSEEDQRRAHNAQRPAPRGEQTKLALEGRSGIFGQPRQRQLICRLRGGAGGDMDRRFRRAADACRRDARLAMHGTAQLGGEFGERRPQRALRIARLRLGQQPPALDLFAIPPYRRPVGRLEGPFGFRPIARLSENERAQAQRPTGRRYGGIAKRRSEEHTSELQSHLNLVCRLLLEKKNNTRRSFFQLIPASRGDFRQRWSLLPPASPVADHSAYHQSAGLASFPYYRHG